MPIPDKKMRQGELPYQVGKGLEDARSGKHEVSNPRGTWQTVIRAAQGNFDHIMSLIRNLVTSYNALVEDVDEIQEALEGNINDTSEALSQLADLDEIPHTDLTGVSADQHHAQSHTQTDHDRAETGDLTAVAATADAGTSTEVPNADHRHAHGTGYAGAHSDAVNDGDAAGGDLGGTYPNPTVTDDSHAHTSATVSGVGHVIEESGTPLTQRANLNFTNGLVASDNTPDTEVRADYGAVGNSDFADVADNGAASSLSRSDHRHGREANPVTAHEAAADPHTGYVLESLLDAVGDIIVASADNTPARLAKGTDGQVLTVDSAETLDLKWATPSASGGKAFAFWGMS